jgi:hypothetical protein
MSESSNVLEAIEDRILELDPMVQKLMKMFEQQPMECSGCRGKLSDCIMWLTQLLSPLSVLQSEAFDHELENREHPNPVIGNGLRKDSHS